jgi:hypothetical protein
MTRDSFKASQNVSTPAGRQKLPILGWMAAPIYSLTPVGEWISPDQPSWAAAVTAFMLYNVPFLVIGAFVYRDPVEKVQRKAERLSGRMHRAWQVAADRRSIAQKLGRK